MAVLDCTITTPERLAFEGEAQSVVVPAADGEMGILPRHAPLIGALGSGELRIEVAGGAKRRFFVSGGGFVEVLKDHVSILVTSLEDLETLERTEAQAALDDVLGRRPQTGDFAEIDSYQEDVRVARHRLRLLRR